MELPCPLSTSAKFLRLAEPLIMISVRIPLHSIQDVSSSSYKFLTFAHAIFD